MVVIGERTAIKKQTTHSPNLTMSGVLQRKCAACGTHTMAGGECRQCGNKKRFALLAKLEVSEPGDQYEQEADRIADQVLSSPANPAVSGVPPRILRFPGQPAGQVAAPAAPASVNRVLSSPGTPLEPVLRQDMEQRFGHDFSAVRVHTDAKAAESAQAVNALAYSVGHDVVFGAGQYAPGTSAGKRLLAHELAHCLQQRPTPVLQRKLSIDPNLPIKAPSGDPAAALSSTARFSTMDTLIQGLCDQFE